MHDILQEKMQGNLKKPSQNSYFLSCNGFCLFSFNAKSANVIHAAHMNTVRVAAHNADADSYAQRV